MNPLARRLTPLLLAAALAAPPPVGSADVAPGDSLQAAIDHARPGDTLEVPPGTYPGPIVVDKPLTLRGVGRPTIDGGGAGTVVRLTAPGVVFTGFEVRGSGIEPDRNDAGISLQAQDITVEDNRLRDVLVGIFVAAADGARLRGNDIGGKDQLDQARKGDGVRVWYSRDVVVEGNRVHQVRDVVLWYAEGARVRGNTISGSRYGIHLMYSDGVRLEDNRLLDNSVGVFVMYSRGAQVEDNLIRGQRGPSGYGLAFKDSDHILARGNVLADDRVGIFLDGTPFGAPESTRFEANLLAFNDIGVLLQPAVRGNRFEGNTFWENTEQVASHGGGVSENFWRGNTWSDYPGFDADGDGIGDLPYEPRRLFESLTSGEPRLRMIIHSPAAQALEFAAAAFPIVRPVALLVDPEPRLAPAPLPEFSRTEAFPAEPLLLAGAAFLGLGLLGVVLGRIPSDAAPSRPARSVPAAEGPALAVTRLTKKYGRLIALDDVSFEARPGEALALWGPNGAGKTTLLNAILGLTSFSGEIRVHGLDVRRRGRQARQRTGYIPQSMAFYDATVLETIRFFSHLRRADPERQLARLEALGLGAHLAASVAALSGGMRQRLALAVALIGEPQLLLLDEPTANLDLDARREHRRLLAGLRREGRTIVFASHRLDEVEALADRVALLERGRLIEVLDPGALRARLVPHVELTVRVAPEQRPETFRLLERGGFEPHLGAPGSIDLRLASEDKLRVLEILREGGVAVVDFDLEQAAWD